MASGVARRPIVDLAAYKAQLSARRDPIAGAMQQIVERVRRVPKRVVFAEGEEEQVIHAACSFVNQGFGTAILVGREERVRAAAEASVSTFRTRESRSTTRASRSTPRSTRSSFTNDCNARATCCATVND